MKHSTSLVFIRIALAMAALFWNFTGASAAEDAIDFQRLRALRARVVAGEKLSPEGQAYYDRGAEEWNRLHGKRSKAPAETAPPAKPPTTAEPLPDKGMREVKAKGSEGFSVSLEAC